MFDKQLLFNNLKNIYGWKTKRKIVVFSVDDYGNIRVGSKSARDALDDLGLKTQSRFDFYDTLETTEDLEMLFETLRCVKDKNGKHAIFTPFTVVCNIDFDKIEKDGFQKYIPEKLSDTFERLSQESSKFYGSVWNIWKEGINEGIFMPQFHGREHFNVRLFNEKLLNKDKELLLSLRYKSNCRIKSFEYPTVNYYAAFDFWDVEEISEFESVLDDGLRIFEELFQYKSKQFNPPAGRESKRLHEFLKSNGIHYIDSPFIKNEHLGHGKFKKELNFTGKRNKLDQLYQVRNVLFEPNDKKEIDWVKFAFKQIEAAFRWNRPAIISSHRVNFSGYMDPKNRKEGLEALEQLLKRIVNRWPNVEFMSADQLSDLIADSKAISNH